MFCLTQYFVTNFVVICSNNNVKQIHQTLWNIAEVRQMFVEQMQLTQFKEYNKTLKFSVFDVHCFSFEGYLYIIFGLIMD